MCATVDEMEGKGSLSFFFSLSPSLRSFRRDAAIVSRDYSLSAQSLFLMLPIIYNRELNRLCYHNRKSHNNDPEGVEVLVQYLGIAEPLRV